MTLLLLNAAVTWFLVGLIWLVQAVHYPLFALVGRAEHTAYHRAHVARITPVVAPTMGLELVTAGLLALDPPGPPAPGWWWLAFGLALSVWAVTGLISVPCHTRLERSFDPATHRRLVASNWLRTAAWTARGALVLWFVTATWRAAGT